MTVYTSYISIETIFAESDVLLVLLIIKLTKIVVFKLTAFTHVVQLFIFPGYNVLSVSTIKSNTALSDKYIFPALILAYPFGDPNFTFKNIPFLSPYLFLIYGNITLILEVFKVIGILAGIL